VLAGDELVAHSPGFLVRLVEYLAQLARRHRAAAALLSGQSVQRLARLLLQLVEPQVEPAKQRPGDAALLFEKRS
jgi:CRP-like cAMP-binding protein